MRCLAGIVLLAAVMVAWCGCGRGGSGNVLVSMDGARVEDFRVNTEAVAYSRRTTTISDATETLVYCDRKTGIETVLESEFVGAFDLSGRKVAYFNRKLASPEGVGPLVLYDADQDEANEVLSADVRRLSLDGNRLVYERGTVVKLKGSGTDVWLFDLSTGTEKKLSTGGEELNAFNERPVVSGDTVAWFCNEWREKKASLMVHDAGSGKTAEINIPAKTAQFAAASSRVVYSYRDETGPGHIRLYDLASGTDTLVADLPRLAIEPAIEGDFIAWGEHIPKEEYKPIPGQPLFDEKDVRNLYLYDIKSGSKREVAGNLFSVGAQVRLCSERVYANVYRNVPPPGASNMSVELELQWW